MDFGGYTVTNEPNYPPVHPIPTRSYSFSRLEMLWERYPQYHTMTTFATLDELLEEHASYREDFEKVQEEYIERGCEKFLIQLSWFDLPYRYATMKLIQGAGEYSENKYVSAFLSQFQGIDTDHKACFIFPESFISHFFVVTEVCKRAEEFHPIRNLFPDEEKIHYLAVFDKRNMDDVLLMFHLLYSSSSQEFYGGYSLYDYSLSWYQTHLCSDGIVLRSPYLPDKLAKYQGSLPYYHNPVKTVFVRRNIEHILECGYFSSELEFFLSLTRDIMPLFQWWYTDIALYEEKDGCKTNWRLARTEIRTKLTAEGIIKPKWKHELSLFHVVRRLYPDTLYQHRPDWLDRQSLDLYIPSLRTAIEYQGIQHYHSVEFFGGEEALEQRQVLDRKKKRLCEENDVLLIEWTYDVEPTEENVRKILSLQ